MSGSVWIFSDQIDDEDMDFMRHEFVTYSIRWRSSGAMTRMPCS